MSQALKLTKAALDAPQNLQGVFEVEAFKSNYVNNYLKTTGKSDGEMKFERERILFMKALQENKKLEQCDRFSIYASFIELAVSGLTLLDGQAYIIPYGQQAQFQIGWKGRLEQIAAMPGIRFVPEPILVYSNDESFDYEIQNGVTVILKHKPAKTHGPEDTIDFVYMTIETDHGFKTWMMSRSEVLAIRDRYSKGYQQYMRNGGKWQDGKPMDPPFWITNEGEAFKKTLVKRAYKYLPKNAKQKALDQKIATHYDHQDGTINEDAAIDYGFEVDPMSEEAKSAQPAGDVKVQQRAPRTPKAKVETPAAATTVQVQGDTVDTDSGEVYSEGPKDDDEADAPTQSAADTRSQAAPVKTEPTQQKANPFMDLKDF